MKAFLLSLTALGLSASALPAEALPTEERYKAAGVYHFVACEVKYGRVHRSQMGDEAIRLLNQFGISPEAAFADASVVTTAELLDRKAGTNCFAY